MAMDSISAIIRETDGAEDLRAVQRFKYDVYVEEMHRYREIADHDNRLLVEEDDPTSHNFLIEVDGEMVGTMRLTWGGDAGAIHARQIDQYDLAPFLEHMGADQLVIAERLMIQPRFRGSDLLMQIFNVMMEFVNARRIQLFIGDSEPHLINTYQAMGFRTYTSRHVNSAATGYLIPLLIVTEDVEYLRRIGSPLANVLTEFADDARVPDNIDELLAGGAAVQSERSLTNEAYMAEIRAAAEKAGALASGLFDGMSDEEIATCVGKSILIACNQGDKVIKQGNVAKNMSMVLSGMFEVRADGNPVAQIGPGEFFGEIAFFLKLPRTADVIATSEGARIVSFNERTIRTLMQSDARTAAKLLYNISAILCDRLNNMNKRL